ncbi:DNA polymerase III subunit gamma and tau [Thermopolyspora sp. NPDC052614]|uniref:DNA polymerase III subunit gamma and tau n=1 Tax=Thermopolyspora sp. NPDC052614 TaxID=3155682 RepID=UPI003438DD50
MSLALYRKYRPGTFAEVKGQEHVTEPLRQALRTGRIHHAYLFSGPRGCGKTSSARILARSLNCEKGPTPDPCGVCESCVALAPTGPGHLDVIEIDAASHGGVDDARDLRERAFFAPVSARFKIYIIDEAHMVTREGFNALLKLVEEPPPHLKFVFATTEPEKVIGTIKSRTHHYPFRLMPPSTLRQLMEEILQAEGVPYEAAALPLAVRAGAGSARDSLSILDQLLAGSDESGITYQRAVSLLGYTDADLLDEVVDAFARRDGAKVFQALNRVIEGGHDPRRFAMDLLERFRDLVVLANVPEAAANGLLDRPDDELERLKAQVALMGPAELTRAAEVFNAGLTEMRGATSPRLLLELMCARVLLPGADQGEASVLARLERLERGVASGSVQVYAQAPAPAAVPAQAAGPVVSQAGGGSVSSAPVGAAQAQTAPAQAAPVQAAPVQGGPVGPSSPGAGSGSSAAPGMSGVSGVRPADDWPEPSRPGSARSEGSHGRQGSGSAAGVPPAAASSAASPTAQASSGGAAAAFQAWPRVLEAIKQRQRVTWSILSTEGRLIGLEGNVATLSFDKPGTMKGFLAGKRDEVVAAALGEVLGGQWRVEAVVGGTGPAGGSGPASVPGPGPGPGSGSGSGARGGPAGGGSFGHASGPGGSAPAAGGAGSGGGTSAGGGFASAGGPAGGGGAVPSGGSGEVGVRGSDGLGGTGASASAARGSAGAGGTAVQTGAGRPASARQSQAASATDDSWPDAPSDDEYEPASPAPTAGLAAARSAAKAAAQARPRTGQPGARQGGGVDAWPDAVPGRRPAADVDEVDPDNDMDADGDGLVGMQLIQRELGGQIIGEIDHT